MRTTSRGLSVPHLKQFSETYYGFHEQIQTLWTKDCPKPTSTTLTCPPLRKLNLPIPFPAWIMMKLLGRNCPKRPFRRKPSFWKCFWLVAVYIHTNWKHQQKHLRAEARRWIALPKTNSSLKINGWKMEINIDIGYRIILSLNVLWILPMAQRWRWKAWLAGSGRWQYGIVEKKMNEDELDKHEYGEYVSTLANKSERWTTRQNVSKVCRERFAISTQLRNAYLPLWLLQWSYSNLYHNLNSKVEFEKPFPSQKSVILFHTFVGPILAHLRSPLGRLKLDIFSPPPSFFGLEVT